MALLKIKNLSTTNTINGSDLLVIETEHGSASISISDITEEWVFTLEDGSTVTKKVVLA